MDVKMTRTWLARKLVQLVRSISRSFFSSLIRFSLSPRWQSMRHAVCGSWGMFVITKRVLSRALFPDAWTTSALKITRRFGAQESGARVRGPLSGVELAHDGRRPEVFEKERLGGMLGHAGCGSCLTWKSSLNPSTALRPHPRLLLLNNPG